MLTRPPPRLLSLSSQGMSKSIGLRMQKKLLGMGVKSKGMAKNFIDDNSGWRSARAVPGRLLLLFVVVLPLIHPDVASCPGELLDNLYQLALEDTGEKKLAKKLLKDLIKIVVKLALLYRHNQFSAEELAVGEKFRKKFRMTVLTMISYHDVAFTYDESFLTNLFSECRVGARQEGGG